MFALADAVEQVEHELTVEKEKCEALTVQAKNFQVRAQLFRWTAFVTDCGCKERNLWNLQNEMQLYRDRAGSLEWQLQIAVPESSIRQLLATQSEQAMIDDDVADMLG
jgi:hypothetical protein